MASYSKIPLGKSVNVRPFKVQVAEEKLQHFRKLLELSPIAPPVFENTNAGTQFGITRSWLEEAKNKWLNEFDWRKHEDRINSYPSFKATVLDGDGNTLDIHFLALFSEKKNAIPVAFLHGWPSSNCEYMDMLDLLKKRYTPAELPYHVVVPCLPGYGYSTGPPLDRDFSIEAAAGAINNLMIELGFGNGYFAQGGDLGSFVSRQLAMTYDNCKGIHVSMMGIPAVQDRQESPMDEEEKRALARGGEFLDSSSAFLLEQGQRPATIGFVLSSSPLALLSWMGEKFLAWTDADLPLERILEEVTLYWMTDTAPRSFWHNRSMYGGSDNPKIARISNIMSMGALRLPYVEKPCGYSMFYNEIVPVPESWAHESCNLVFFNKHSRGGHFPAMEKTQELVDDLEEYIKRAQDTP
ncbi:alpha/beta-hydrolase [Sarocladium strictum]